MKKARAEQWESQVLFFTQLALGADRDRFLIFAPQREWSANLEARSTRRSDVVATRTVRASNLEPETYISNYVELHFGAIYHSKDRNPRAGACAKWVCVKSSTGSITR